MNTPVFLLLALIGLASLGGCAGMSHFAAYDPVSPRLTDSQPAIVLNVLSMQGTFQFDSRISGTDVQRHVQDALAREFRAAGYRLVPDPEDADAVVEAEIQQVDVGYELYFWWYYVGYSSSELLGTAQLRVSVTDLRSGAQYERRFAGYENSHARKFWFTFIPIPLGIQDDSQVVLRRVMQTVFGQVVQAVNSLLNPAAKEVVER